MHTPLDIVNALRHMSAKDFLAQLDYDQEHRVSRFILVREFVQDALERKENKEEEVVQ